MLSACADPEGGGGAGGPDPLKNHKNIVFSNTGPDPLENHKAAKPAFNVGPSSTMMARFQWYLDPLFTNQLKKSQ